MNFVSTTIPIWQWTRTSPIITFFCLVLLLSCYETTPSSPSASWGVVVVHALSVSYTSSSSRQPPRGRSVSGNPFFLSSSSSISLRIMKSSALQTSSSSSSGTTSTTSNTSTTTTSVSTTNNNNNDKENDSSAPSFRIRKINFSELDQVSKIILVSFYKKEFQQDIWKHLCSMQELNRLQSNFPYADPQHYMYAAVVEECQEPPSPSARRTLQNSNPRPQTKIVGFVDIDARTPKQVTDPPRPYLSDLCIHPHYRRQGIARALVQKCEETVQQLFSNHNHNHKDEMYIRVEQDNDAARAMYEAMGYKHQLHDIFGVRDTTMLLHRSFQDTINDNDNDSTNGSDVKENNPNNNPNSSHEQTALKGEVEEEQSVTTGITNGTVPVLDYVV